MSLLVRLLARTWRVRREGAAPSGPAVIAIRHGDLLPLLGTHLDRGYCAMVSLSRDGDRLASVLAHLGFTCVRGSSSRGGREALAAAREVLARGGVVVIATDGPRGPAEHVAPGVLALARDAPLHALSASGGGARLDTWDRARIPHPFARVRVQARRVDPADGPEGVRAAWHTPAPDGPPAAGGVTGGGQPPVP